MTCNSCNSLEEVRENIDRIDNEIIKLIAERGEYVKQAAKFKKSESAVRDNSRVEAVVKNARKKAGNYGADQDIIEAVYRVMISKFIGSEMNEFKEASS